MSKKVRDERKELRVPRIIITISLIVLIIAYFICLATKELSYNSVICIIIAIAAGTLLFTLGMVIRSMNKRVDLDYDSIVVWKMCVVAGVVIAGFGVLCIFV